MHSTAKKFKEQAQDGLNNPTLQDALGKLGFGFPLLRQIAADGLPEFDALRDIGRDVRNHTLEYLDYYLETFEANVTSHGGTVHWCPTDDDARDAILQICQTAGAKTVTKGKSMVTEEIAINRYLEDHGIKAIETDLGEYIIQLRDEPPSHIVGPAIHLKKEQIAETFRSHHTQYDPDRTLEDVPTIVREAREILRQKYIDADVGITGANFLVAETGTSIIVTNEGNGDLSQTLPKVHIVVASIEKVIPTLEDACTLLRLLARSATGQEFSAYTTFSTGPKRSDDPDGPEQYHVILLDNGRSDLLGTEFQDVLRCIRCAACMNHCPVYTSVGGHAYGSVYPGPIGSVLTPALTGIEQSHHLPNASTFCGKCEEVCPMHIPLPKMMRYWREKAFDQQLDPPVNRWALAFWAWCARTPSFYHLGTGLMSRVLHYLGRREGHLVRLPFASAWTKHRDFPTPEKATFQSQWRKRS